MKATKSNKTPYTGPRMIVQKTTASMPDLEERTGYYDPDEEYAWDSDNPYPFDPADEDEEED